MKKKEKRKIEVQLLGDLIRKRYGEPKKEERKGVDLSLGKIILSPFRLFWLLLTLPVKILGWLAVKLLPPTYVE